MNVRRQLNVCESAESGTRCRSSQEMDRDLWAFIRRVLLFVSIPLLVYLPYLPVGIFFGNSILERANGPDTESQITSSFQIADHREFDLLLLGNSRIYRGLNPDQFSIPTFNFGCDNDSFNQMYYKLKWLRDRNHHITSLVLGVDYFQFSVWKSDRNFAYSRFLDPEYAAGYPPDRSTEFRRWLRRFPKTLNPKYLLTSAADRPYLRTSGQYIFPGTAQPTDSVARDSRRNTLLVSYFERILDDCEAHGTKVFLCIMPMRHEEIRAYRPGEIEEFRKFLAPYLDDDVRLIDLSTDHEFTVADFTDITHLNASAADRCSDRLNGLIMNDLSEDEGNLRLTENPETPAQH